MANGRTERISRRDLEVLEFVARFGVVSRDAVAAWAGTAQRCTFDPERHALRVKVVTFKRLAEECAERLRSGDQVGVTGHLRSEELPRRSPRRLFVHTVIGRQVDSSSVAPMPKAGATEDERSGLGGDSENHRRSCEVVVRSCPAARRAGVRCSA